MDGRQRIKRHLAVVFWRIANPPTRLLAGIAPWWVLVETTGNKTGKRRRTPIATGPYDDSGIELIAAHGRHSAWVKNLEANPAVRIKLNRRWRDGDASIVELEQNKLGGYNLYARQAAGAIGIDPVVVRIDWR
jgi:deazaflavin-dependent oxidoreductase (nitroreductase family)